MTNDLGCRLTFVFQHQNGIYLLMDRKSFLKELGLSSAGLMALLSLQTLTSCSSYKTESPQTNPGTGNNPVNSGVTVNNTGGSTGKIDFTLDLSAPTNASLAKNGGFVISGNVIVARTNTGELIALSKVCTHSGCSVTFSGGGKDI
jgi:cytochrome b6-f complex iron-sulfur subunit